MNVLLVQRWCNDVGANVFVGVFRDTPEVMAVFGKDDNYSVETVPLLSMNGGFNG